MNAILNQRPPATDWADSPSTLGATTGGNPFPKIERKSFDERYPKVKTPAQLTATQKANFASQVLLFDTGANELELALSRIASDQYVNPIYIPQLLRQIIEAWREEACPETRGPMRSDDRVASHRKSNELAGRKLLEGSEMLAKSDAAAEHARKAAEIALEQQRAIEALWFELSGIPKQVELLKSRLAAISNERAALDSARLEEAYESLYISQFTGGTAIGDINQIWCSIQQVQRKLSLLENAEKKLNTEIARLESRERQLRKELK
jgi:hypothetical protein